MMDMMGTTLLAKPLITWTVETYYVAVAIVHFLTILIGFKLLHADTENNLVVGSLVVAVAAGVAGYMTSDMGLIGVIITGSTLFGLMLFISAGDALRSLVLAGVCIVVYAGAGAFLVPRTPLTSMQIGGFTSAFIDGLDEEPLGNEEDLYEHTKKKTDQSLAEDE